MLRFFKPYMNKRLLSIVCLGFSSGLPFVLKGATLFWWLAQKGVDKTTIGLFSLLSAPYVFKPLWAPILDRVRIPILHGYLGRRRSWLLCTQILLSMTIVCLGYSGSQNTLLYTAVIAFCIAFLSATQDILIDAFRIERLKKKEFGAGAGAEVFGYRLGMMVAGGGALALSDYMPWTHVYTIMALCMSVGIVTTLLSKEPDVSHEVAYKAQTPLQWLATSIVSPFIEFMKRPGWLFILVFIVIYRLGDHLVGGMSTVFYKEMGFSGSEVGFVTKTMGIWITIAGGIVGGAISYRIGVMRTMLWGGIIHLCSNAFFIVLANTGHSLLLLFCTVLSENLSSGIMTSGFVAYLSRLCNKDFTATQYALFTSLMAFGRTTFSAFSGKLASMYEWPAFFVAVSCAALPGLFLLCWLMRRYPLDNKASKVQL